MAEITLDIPDDVKERMEKHEDIDWNQIAQKAIEERLRSLELAEIITSHSQLTDEDAKDIAKNVKQEMAKRHGLR